MFGWPRHIAPARAIASKLSRLTLAVCLAGGLAACAGAAKPDLEEPTITVLPHPDAARIVSLEGPITNIAANADIRAAEWLVLNSPGGRLSDAAALARHLQRNGTTVIVPNDAVCMSACLVIMSAADRVVVGQDAVLLLHDASSFGRHSADGTALVKGYLRAFGWPADVVDRGVRRNGQLIFSGAEAEEWGIAHGLTCATLDAADAANAQRCSVDDAIAQLTTAHN